MDKIIIKGGRRLQGTVRIAGAKNAALPMLVSAMLSDGISTFHNVPNLQDIHSTKLLLEQLGGCVETRGRTVRIQAANLNNHEAPYDLVRKMRASILVLGPLVARMKKARVSLPGGCAIGARPINLHLKGLELLGATIKLDHGYVEAEAERLVGNEIFFDIPTVTGTENLMMAAVLAEGTTILRNSAREPEILALAETLNMMGARVHGAGTSVIEIQGVERLDPVETTIIPDRIEAGTLMVAAALTRGDITLENCNPAHMQAVIHKLRQTGAQIETGDTHIHVGGGDRIESANLKTLPYPGFPTDMQAQFMVLMSVAAGTSMIAETIFENRFIHVSELRRLGADITISGNSAMVKGVEALSGAPVMATDLRASACLLLAGLVAQNSTVINRVYHLDRGYEALDEKLAGLGADIHRVK